MASIPLSGSIRLGDHFNNQFYHGNSNSAQNSLGSDRMRHVSKSTTVSNDVPWTGQVSMSAYRGTTGCYMSDYQNKGSTPTFTDQWKGWATYGGAGNGWARPKYNSNDYGANVVALYGSSDTEGAGSSNYANNLVHYVGYLEPGTYKAYANFGIYNSGTTYMIVRGYKSPNMTGASSNYVYSNRSRGTGSWETRSMGSGNFTVSSSYPYVILDIEAHNLDGRYYIRMITTRKDTTSNKAGFSSNNYTHPHIVRIS